MDGLLQTLGMTQEELGLLALFVDFVFALIFRDHLLKLVKYLLRSSDD